MAAELNGGTPGTLLGEESQSFVGYVQNAEWLLPEDADETQPRLTPVQWGAGGSRNVRCESQDDRYAYCPTYTRGRVQLQRQLSNAPCRRYETWGTEGDGSGIWVRNGCRAIFSVGRGGGGEGWVEEVGVGVEEVVAVEGALPVGPNTLITTAARFIIKAEESG